MVDTAISTGKVFAFDGISAGCSAGYVYLCVFSPGETSLLWKAVFVVIGGAQAAAVPALRSLRLLTYVSEYATLTLRYLYLGSYMGSIFVVALLLGQIMQVQSWIED